MTDTDKPAMQVQGVFPVSARIHHELMAHEATLRDYFAAQAMQWVASDVPAGKVAVLAYLMADAMLEARKKK